ncbi:hypothetical protein GM3708_1251 [Geminocystis sp. NIES-3708]|uniref:hypothetical protein n=1 Tax=Geminocystis sp. NIES-3708 TaxID=1615909 RepID=UPI0005FC46E3|nr:hypothetical protein [Geminocystis sp. NIES-3708]BAQ60845.1 hypothetical protein GM3708_1251 [Geminocystis sp. NIES-3708]
MALNKFFGKKEKNYFLEIETKTENESSAQVEENKEESTLKTSITEEKETVAATTIKPKADISYDVPDWVKAIKNYSNQSNSSASATEGENFAGKYVTNNVPQSRRRPGPSLATFKDMASKIGK